MSARKMKWIGVSITILLIAGLAVLAASRTNLAAASAPAQAQPDESEKGVVVVHVDRGGPADQAGVKRGDILLSIDDQEVNSPLDVLRVLEAHETGDEVSLVLMHGDERRTLTATLAEHYDRPYLGLLAYGSPRLDFAPIASQPGATIIEVEPDSPAAQAGLQENDRIVAVDGKDLEGDLAGVISAHEQGDRVTLTIERQGEEDPIEVTVTLGAHPDKEGAAYLGVRYAAQPFLMDLFGKEGPGPDFRFVWPKGEFAPGMPLPGVEGIENGLVVGEVASDSPAAEAGLRSGDVITAIDGAPVTHLRSLREAVAARKPGDKLALSVLRDGETIELEATLAGHPDDENRPYLGVTALGFFGTRVFPNGAMPEGWPDFDFKFRVPFDGFRIPFGPDEPPAEDPGSTIL